MEAQVHLVSVTDKAESKKAFLDIYLYSINGYNAVYDAVGILIPKMHLRNSKLFPSYSEA